MLARVVIHVLARVLLHVLVWCSMVLARVVIHVLARVLPHVLARVLLHVLARVIIHVHDYYSKTCNQVANDPKGQVVLDNTHCMDCTAFLIWFSLIQLGAESADVSLISEVH